MTNRWSDPVNYESEDYKHRKQLPKPMATKNDFKVWNFLKNSVGSDLSKITMPAAFNEPISFLQRVSEYLEYAHLLHAANQSNDPLVRMEYVAAFAVSAVASNWRRIGKPFNPLLGETFELNRQEERGYQIVCEQVSHHPPISAFYVEGDPVFRFHGSIEPRLKFWGKSLEITPKGHVTLELLNHGEVYTWRNVKCHVQNLIVGKLWVEHCGTMQITNHSTKHITELEWKSSNSWFGGKEFHRVEGFILGSDKQKLRALYGKWTEAIYSVDVDTWDKHSKEMRKNPRSSSPLPENLLDGAVSKLGQMSFFSSPNTFSFSDDTLESSHSTTASENNSINLESPSFRQNTSGNNCSQMDGEAACSPCDMHLPGQRLLWTANPRPESSSMYYNFTYFALALNEVESPQFLDSLPLTDSRRRPDMRLLEEALIDEAQLQKERLEEKQRKFQKERKKDKIKHWSPLWFKYETNKYTNKTDWVYCGNYFKRDFSHCEAIF